MAADQVDALEASLSREFTVERFAHRINVSAPDSNLRVQIQTDARYAGFLERAVVRNVMDFQLPVARVLEVAPELRGRVPAQILARIPSQSE